jgi:serine/threonine protein kinase
VREGDTLQDQYRLCERVGRGTHGTVWRAEEVHGGQATVAVKAFHDQPDQNEMRMLARLDHPHVLRYRATLVHEGTLCLVTDYADGGDVAGLLSAYPEGLPADQVVAIILPLAEALAYLHAERIVHRDVKPLNLLFVNGRLRLADVGLARALEQSTMRGSSVATPLYAAPELFNGVISTSADIYALGVTAFELLTGRPPFTGTLHEVMKGHLEREPDWPDSVPEALRVLFGACLSKQASLRPSAVKVAAALASESSQPPPPPPPPPPGPRALLLAVGGTLILGALWLMFGARVFKQQSGPPDFTHRSPSPPSASSRVRPTGPPSASISAKRTSKPSASLTRIESQLLKHLASPLQALALSRRSAAIAVGGADGVISVWSSPAASAAKTYRPNVYGAGAAVSCLAYSQDGRWLCGGSSGGTAWAFRDDYPKSKWVPLKARFGEPISAVAFAHDDSFVAAASLDRSVRLWDMPTGRFRRTLDGYPRGVLGLAVSPAGGLLATADATGVLRLTDPERGKVSLKASAHAGSTRGLAFTALGNWLVSGGSDGVLRVWLTSKLIRVLTIPCHEPVQCVAVSLEGRLAAGVGKHVRVWDLSSGRQLSEIAGHSDQVTGVAWHHEGRTLYSVGKDGDLRQARLP